MQNISIAVKGAVRRCPTAPLPPHTHPRPTVRPHSQPHSAWTTQPLATPTPRPACSDMHPALPTHTHRRAPCTALPPPGAGGRLLPSTSSFASPTCPCSPPPPPLYHTSPSSPCPRIPPPVPPPAHPVCACCVGCVLFAACHRQEEHQRVLGGACEHGRDRNGWGGRAAGPGWSKRVLQRVWCVASSRSPCFVSPSFSYLSLSHPARWTPPPSLPAATSKHRGWSMPRLGPTSTLGCLGNVECGLGGNPLAYTFPCPCLSFNTSY